MDYYIDTLDAFVRKNIMDMNKSKNLNTNVCCWAIFFHYAFNFETIYPLVHNIIWC